MAVNNIEHRKSLLEIVLIVNLKLEPFKSLQFLLNQTLYQHLYELQK